MRIDVPLMKREKNLLEFFLNKKEKHLRNQNISMVCAVGRCFKA